MKTVRQTELHYRIRHVVGPDGRKRAVVDAWDAMLIYWRAILMKTRRAPR